VPLSGIADVLSWRHALETSHDPNYLTPGRRVVVYPKFLDKLGEVFASGDIGIDRVQSRWPADKTILVQSMTWPHDKRPVLLPEGDHRLPIWSIPIAQAMEWMEDAKRIAVAGRRQVLEDGPDVCDDEPDQRAEYSDHGEELERMYVAGASLASARLTTAEANALRAQPGDGPFRNPTNDNQRPLGR
jgi:hypothetical protein